MALPAVADSALLKFRVKLLGNLSHHLLKLILIMLLRQVDLGCQVNLFESPNL
jgi:hypothetical protein